MQILKKCINDFSQEMEECRSHVKCRYKIIGKLIFIEVLWKSFHFNTLIKDEL